MQSDKVQRLSFGDVIMCDFTMSSPVYQENAFEKTNLYRGKHPALFLVWHKDSQKNGTVALVCPMSSEMRYADLDKELIRISRIDVQNSKLDKDMHTVNCRMLISLYNAQIPCDSSYGRIKDSKLTEVSLRVKNHLKPVSEFQPIVLV